MQLTDEQKARVAEWIEQGLQPFEIQKRLAEEFGIHLTYMEVKLLLSELNLTPKDLTPPSRQTPQSEVEKGEAATGRSVSVTVDQVARPGAVVSGRVRFSDGKEASWYIDQLGRLGMVPPEPGYRPSQSDLAEFQRLLEEELSKMGY